MLVMLFENPSIFWNEGGNWMAHFEIVSLSQDRTRFLYKDT